MVGVAGFEPTTLCPPDKCATRLRYTPTRGKPYRTGPFEASGDLVAMGTRAEKSRCSVKMSRPKVPRRAASISLSVLDPRASNQLFS
jgi:hypothetical protein